MKNSEILQKIKSVKYCMIAHPDNIKDSEFEDRIEDLQEIEDFLSKGVSIQVVNNFKEPKNIINIETNNSDIYL